jgi:hypothetical protein
MVPPQATFLGWGESRAAVARRGEDPYSKVYGDETERRDRRRRKIQHGTVP